MIDTTKIPARTPQHIRSFSTEVSKNSTLEIGFLDLGENSTVTSVILVLNSHTSNPTYKHITKKVMNTWGLREYCNNAMMDYLDLCHCDDDERFDEAETREEFTGIHLDHYELFVNESKR